MDTRLLRADKELSHQQGSSMHPCVERVDEGEVERGISVWKSTR